MTWNDVLEFSRGPLFQAALLAFVGGMAYRLARIVLLRWQSDWFSGRTGKLGMVVRSYTTGLGILPFIPWVKNTFRRNPVIYLAGGLFHLGLFAVIFLLTAHMLVWKSLLGFGWPSLSQPIVDWLAAGAIVAMLALLVNRLINPVLRLLSGTAEWLNWSIVFLPMVTGYMLTHHLWFAYEVLFSLHMLVVDALLIWIPLSRISHFMFYFFSRTIHGLQFSQRRMTT